MAFQAMFSITSLLAIFLLLVSFNNGVAATPLASIRESPVTLQFARTLNITGFGNLAEADRARAKVLKSQSRAAAKGKRSGVSSFSVTNTAVAYTANVGIGIPATYYTLLVDTGSSNTWIGADNPYKKTNTSVCTTKTFSVNYGSGFASGIYCTDTVTLSPALVVTKQGLGIANSSTGFTSVDGILGLGPSDLTIGTIGGSSAPVATVTDNLYTQGTIPVDAVGIYYAPTTSDSDTNGELTFGGPDPSKYTGTLTYTPITSTSPASEYWGINESITYGSTSILTSTAGIVDTGTTLILIATNAYNKYVSATGAKLDSTTGLLKITSAQYSALQSLNFRIGSVTYSLTPNAQIWPRALNTYIGGTSTGIYLIVGDLGSDSGEGLDFINGYTFLERFYSYFDTTNKRLGFATTAYPNATTN